MRTTVTIDDALFERALQVAEPGIEKADLIREAVKTYVRVQSAKRLAALGGAAPQMPHIPRRQQEPAET
ncbi:type II toxin-antitoxin system VapB family antitoxin [Pusillimonas noertemannii]|uniref:type II toxin-antitoxin system VapB family antitoxin n=1 Tax=Pusillimonas noertemannii TaxID=305977 RepID=UPI000E3071ED|nr:type II toxin-antitoxin system VapB family antitoxin [Pusillimonas noertemannii]NYT67573.1 type II toxin-antitoxin system VapB family antitoxin [Pusillimonas noertemannii]TFL12259.1 type II toxin-antitoxin system VapB family antitoxin [Pusillimonas noertemannii]